MHMRKAKKTASRSSSGDKNSTGKIIILTAAVTAALMLVCFFTYRFLFPGEISTPAEARAAEVSGERKYEDESSAPGMAGQETVKDYPITVYAGDNELSALYSGKLVNGAPYGSGTYRFSGPDGDWSFIGTLKDGCISGGQVTDYPYVFELEDENSRSSFTGTLVGGIPKGDGTFEIVSGDDVIRLQGYYNSEKKFSGTVENYPLSFGYNDFIFEGRYTGELRFDFPDGEGEFRSEGENYYLYSGTWSSGSPVGPGTLFTNCASFSSSDGSNYLAVYNGGIENSQFSGEGDMTIGDEVSGGYSYSGGWKDGAFSGKGTLICYDPTGNGYTYEGNFSEGAYNGEGRLIFDNPNVIKYIGSFENGNFRPNPSELITAFCSAGSSSAEFTEQVRNYLKSHQESLLTHKTDDLYFGSGFSYESYSQTESNTDDRCFSTTVILLQKTEYDASVFGYPVTELLGYANGGRYVYYGYYLGSLSDAESGDIIRITAYPLCFSSYTDAAGNKVPALRFAAFEVSMV